MPRAECARESGVSRSVQITTYVRPAMRFAYNWPPLCSPGRASRRPMIESATAGADGDAIPAGDQGVDRDTWLEGSDAHLMAAGSPVLEGNEGRPRRQGRRQLKKSVVGSDDSQVRGLWRLRVRSLSPDVEGQKERDERACVFGYGHRGTRPLVHGAPARSARSSRLRRSFSISVSSASRTGLNSSDTIWMFRIWLCVGSRSSASCTGPLPTRATRSTAALVQRAGRASGRATTTIGHSDYDKM